MIIAARDADRFAAAPPKTLRAALVFGPDSGLVQERAEKLMKSVVRDLADPFNVSDISDTVLESDPARLADEAAAISMMGGRRVVRVRGAGNGMAELFDSFLDDPPGDSLVVVEAGDLAKSAALRKLFEENEQAAAIACYPDTARSLEDLVRDVMRAEGLAIAPDALADAVSRLGIHQVNRGKSAALSHAMAEAQTEIVVTIDADTEIEPDAISKLVRHFSDPRLGAVAGNVKVGNRSRWLTRWQALEYITSQNMEKRAFDLLNCITVVPGALGAWRKEAIAAAGGITADTVAEDADLTIAIRRLGWRIGYDEESIAWTEAPETASQLIRQRFRWTFGTLQAFWKHSDTLFRPKFGTLGWVALPNVFIFQLVLPLISPVIDLMFFGSLVLWALGQKVAHLPQIWTTADVERSVLFFLGFLIIDVLTCAIAFLLEPNEDWTLLIPVLLQRFYYRQLMYVVLFRSVKEAISGRPVGWRGVEADRPKAVATA